MKAAKNSQRRVLAPYRIPALKSGAVSLVAALFIGLDILPQGVATSDEGSYLPRPSRVLFHNARNSTSTIHPIFSLTFTSLCAGHRFQPQEPRSRVAIKVFMAR